MYIFGFLGKKRSGKDTSAQFTKDYFESKGLKTCVLRFAHPLKRLLSQMTGQPYALFDDDDTKEKVLSPELVKTMHECSAKFDPMTWEDALKIYNAQSMKEIAKVIFEFVHLFEKKIKISMDLTPRWMLQTLGTDHLRNKFSDTIWVDLLEVQDLKHARGIGIDVLIIPDVRFKTEVDMLMKYPNTFFIRVHRPTTHLGISNDRLHSSETELDDFTAPNLKEVHNNATKDDLHYRLLATLRLLYRG